MNGKVPDNFERKLNILKKRQTGEPSVLSSDRWIYKIASKDRDVDRLRTEHSIHVKIYSYPELRQYIPKPSNFFIFYDVWYFRMERIEGQTLQEANVQDMTAVTLEILRIIGLFNEKGIYHRDLNINNIMVTETGMIKFIDFENSYHLDTKIGHVGDEYYPVPKYPSHDVCIFMRSLGQKLRDPFDPFLAKYGEIMRAYEAEHKKHDKTVSHAEEIIKMRKDDQLQYPRIRYVACAYDYLIVGEFDFKSMHPDNLIAYLNGQQHQDGSGAVKT